MANPFSTLARRLKYGASIIIVSGLPRSGTSMMMKMLDAAGLPILTDNLRTADEDNPKGYYEYERVKNLEKERDKSWVRLARGKVLKVISFLLKDLPPDNCYRILFMRRDIDEVLASQNKMLERRGKKKPGKDEEAKAYFLEHIHQVRQLNELRSNFEMLEIDYRQALDDPRGFATAVNTFLGGHLDIERMVGVVDRQLYRNRKEKLPQSP